MHQRGDTTAPIAKVHAGRVLDEQRLQMRTRAAYRVVPFIRGQRIGGRLGDERRHEDYATHRGRQQRSHSHRNSWRRRLYARASMFSEGVNAFGGFPAGPVRNRSFLDDCGRYRPCLSIVFMRKALVITALLLATVSCGDDETDPTPNPADDHDHDYGGRGEPKERHNQCRRTDNLGELRHRAAPTEQQSSSRTYGLPRV